TRNRVARHAERELLRPRMAKGKRSAERRKERKARRLVHPGDDEVNLVQRGLGVIRGRFAYGRSCRGSCQLPNSHGTTTSSPKAAPPFGPRLVRHLLAVGRLRPKRLAHCQKRNPRARDRPDNCPFH